MGPATRSDAEGPVASVWKAQGHVDPGALIAHARTRAEHVWLGGRTEPNSATEARMPSAGGRPVDVDAPGVDEAEDPGAHWQDDYWVPESDAQLGAREQRGVARKALLGPPPQRRATA